MDHADRPAQRTAVPAPPPPSPSPPATRRVGRRSLVIAATGWVAVNAWVALTVERRPFDWPARPGGSVGQDLLDANLALVQVLLLMGVVHLLTRRRARPDVAARAPDRTTSLRETLLLLGYGALGLAGGFLLARALGWHPFALHVAGSIYGTHSAVEPAEILTWAGYNLLVYAVVPLAWFRRRYSALALGLRSTDRRGDLLVIVVVLLLELTFQVLALEPRIVDLAPRQLMLGAPLTFLLYLAGAVLPAMVFIYAILVPRYLRLTGSPTATVILGGLTYAALHVWDAWTVLTSPNALLVSGIFLLLTYLGPGMIKTYLTLRTGNAWVHVWAYHALAPHTLVDTPHVVHSFGIR